MRPSALLGVATREGQTNQSCQEITLTWRTYLQADRLLCGIFLLHFYGKFYRFYRPGVIITFVTI